MKLLLLLACLVLAAASSNSGVSKKVMNFFSYVNGNFDNENQTQQPGDDHALIQVRNVPVDIECFRPNPVLFVEEAVNGVIRKFRLLVVTDGIEDTVSVAVYKFSNQSNYKPGEYKVENFSNVSCGDLQRVDNCTGSYRVADGYVYGNFQECNYTVGGKHPRFTGLFSCDSITITTPQNADQVSPIEPYELQHKTKYPLINPPEGYVAPCGPKIKNITYTTNMEPSSS
ncbi:hypothetical protein BsWGS_23125 [Bradybaena similaris]